jgi:hypothetical protein
MGVVVVGILVAVMREALSGPTFRASDHASYAECVAAIPREWRPGSLEQSGAEAACRYEHERRLRQAQ